MIKTITPQVKAFALCCFLSLFSFNLFAQVGINTISPTTMLDVNGAISFREGPTLSLTNGVNNITSLGTTPFSQYRITGPNAAFSIRNILPLASADGQMLTLINTTSYPLTILHEGSGTAARKIRCPGETNLVLFGKYSTVTLQYNKNLGRWLVISYAESSSKIDSVTLTSNQTISGSTYTAVPGMSLTFTARNPSVLVMLSASGLGYTNSVGNVYLKVRNISSGADIGGTKTKIQNLTLVTYLDYPVIRIAASYSTTAWSASFTKLLTDLTIGQSYTLIIQGKTETIYGADGAVIDSAASPNDCHLTLSAIQ